MDKVRKAIRKGKGLKPLSPQQQLRDNIRSNPMPQSNNLGICACLQIINLLTAHPELRLGQVISLCAKLGGWMPDDIFYCPDDLIAEGARLFNNSTKGVEPHVGTK